jgi:putative ABC transport system permease protein
MWRRPRVVDTLQEDIRDHLEREIDEGIARGLTPEVARRQARLKFGNTALVTEDTRAVWTRPWVDALRFEFRGAFRALARDRGFVAIVLVSLALGIGASTTMFSVLHAVLVQPLPYASPERLFNLAEGTGHQPPSWEEVYAGRSVFEAIRDHATSVESIAAYSTPAQTLQLDGEALRLVTAAVSSSFFDVLGVKPLHGRFLREDEDQPGAPAAVVLGEVLWRDRFAAEPSMLGRSILLDEQPHVVVGIAPESLEFPLADVALWTSHARRFKPRGDQARNEWRDAVLVRLKPGVSVESAEAELTAFARQIQTEAPAASDSPPGGPPAIALFGLQERLTRSVRTPVLLLLGAALTLLFVVTSNVAHLCLIRSLKQRQEFAVRAALGGSVGRIIVGLCAQCLVLAAVGGGLGVVLAIVFTHGLVAIAPREFPRIQEIAINGEALAFALSVSVVSVFAAGVAPTWWNIRRDLRAPAAATRDPYTARAGAARLRGLTGTLLLAQLAFSTVLLIVGSLLARSFVNLTAVDPGYTPARVLTAQVALPPSMPRPLQKDVAERLVRQLASAPSVESVGLTSVLPLEKAHVMFEVRPTADSRDRMRMAYRVVSPGYLETVGMRLLAGRTLAWSDTDSTPLAAVVNETFVRRNFQDRDPIGAELSSGTTGRPWVIVGVVQDVRYNGLDQTTMPTLYTSFLQREQVTFFNRLDLAVRTTSDPGSFAPTLRDIVRQTDSRLATFGVATMEEQLSASVARPRLYSGTVTIFAALSLIVAAIGLHGALAYAVTLRRREIAIRTALGAAAGAVVRLVLRDVVVITIVGVVLGGVGGVVAARYLDNLLFGVEPLDVPTFVIAPCLILTVAICASHIPLRTATLVPPSSILKAD